MASGYIDLPQSGGAGVISLNGQTGALTLVAGSNITITPGAGTLTISSTASGGIASINTDTTAAQILSVGTAGTDFAITNPGAGSHVFNLPTASAVNRGALSSADWSAFNAKQSTITIGALDAQAANANGLALVSNVLSAQSADATHPGMVNNTAQTLSGQKTFSASPLIPDGTVSLPGLAFTNETSSGLYRVGPNNIGLSAFGSEGIDFHQIGAGQVNVGIGIAASAGSTNFFTANRTLNGIVDYNFGNASAGANSATIFQIANGPSSNYTLIENWANTTTGYLAGGSALFANNNQLFLNVGSEFPTGSIRFNVGGRTLATERMRLNTTDLTLGVPLGIGVTPAANVPLDVVADTSAATQVEQLTGYGANNIGIRIRHARGTSIVPTALLSGDPLGFIGARGYGTGQFAAQNTGSIQFQAAENFTNTANGTNIIFNTTPIGSVTLAQAMSLSSTLLTLSAGIGSRLTGSVSGTFTMQAAATTASYSVTMPAAQGAANTVQLNDGAGNLSWTAFPSTYVVSSINSNTSAVAGTTYLCDTSGGAFNLTLPTPVSGTFVVIKDKTGSFQTNGLSVLQHASEKIEGLATTKLLSTNWGSWSFFSDGTDWYMGPF